MNRSESYAPPAGIQSVKMALFFGAVNAFQWYANSWK